MNRKKLLIGTGAAAVGFVIVLLAAGESYRHFRDKREAAEKPVFPSLAIVVAAKDLPAGTPITPDTAAVAAWPRQSLPGDAFSNPRTVQGRMVRRDLAQGEPITESKLFPSGEGAVVPLMVPVGKRAFTVNVDEGPGTLDCLVPGSRIDLLVSLPAPSPAGDRQARTLVEDAKVLAAGRTVRQRNGASTEAATVTLALTPEEVEKLVAAGNGIFRISLRNYSDSGRAAARSGEPGPLAAGTGSAGRVSAASPEKPGAPAKSAARKPLPRPKDPRNAAFVEIIQGAERSKVKIR